MKWVRRLLLAFSSPALLIVGGTVWGPFMDWDLTQPQATLIAGFVAGPFLISAAYIAFHGQRENMKTERDKFNEQIQLQKNQAKDELQLKRDQWVAEQRLTNARNERDRDSALFAQVLAFYAEFARAVGRTERAIPKLPDEEDADKQWAEAGAYLTDVVKASNDNNDFTSELRLAGYASSEFPLNGVHSAMRNARTALEQAVAKNLQDVELEAFIRPSIDSFATKFNDLTKRAVAALEKRDEDVLSLATALEVVDRGAPPSN
jgi:hypothetical protein